MRLITSLNHPQSIITKIGLATILTACSLPIFALTPTEQKQIDHLQQLFKQNNTSAISQSIRYPLQREEPVPAVLNAKEMEKRFNQIFDAQLKQDISRSKPNQWNAMGWRGLMLDGGKVWFDGEKITAINYSSKAEQQYKLELIGVQKQQLHPSLRSFKAPVLAFKTKSFKVRIDELSDGKYRYASWKIGQKQSDQPALVIKNGRVEFDGSGGNHAYLFKNGAYSYTVERMVLGTGKTPEIYLTVKRADTAILKQAGSIAK